jgi:hypothetical protein
MKTIASVIVLLSLSAPAWADKSVALICAYTSRAGGKGFVSVERNGDKVTGIIVRSGKTELTLREGSGSSAGAKVTSWAVNPYRATEVDFTVTEGKNQVVGHASFEPQEDIFRFEMKGAPASLRKALKLKGGWFVLALHPGKSDCQIATVGVASMEKDGSLRMQYRSIDHGMVAEAQELVPKDDSKHKQYLDHLGGLKVGESKPIPEFPPTGESY